MTCGKNIKSPNKLLVYLSIILFFLIIPSKVFAGEVIDLLDTTKYNHQISGQNSEDAYFSEFADINGNGQTDWIIGTTHAPLDNQISGLIIAFDYFTRDNNQKNISINDTSFYNLYLESDGYVSGYFGFYVFDIDNDGKDDIISTGWEQPYETYDGYDSDVAIYLGKDLAAYDSTFGNTVYGKNLISASYYHSLSDNILGSKVIEVGDVNNNGLPDLLMSSYHHFGSIGYKTGAVFIVYDDLISSHLEYGYDTPIDLAETSNYSLFIEGSSQNEYLGEFGLKVADINNNDINDLVIASMGYYYDRDGVSYIITDDIISSQDDKSILLSEPNSYYVRLTGEKNSDYTGMLDTGDFDGDGLVDIAMAGYRADSNGKTDNGSIYLIENSIFQGHSNGTTISMSSQDNYTVRVDGADSSDNLMNYMGYEFLTDYNNNGKDDLLIASMYHDHEGRTDSGAYYVIYDDILSDASSKSLSLSDAANYSYKIVGPTSSQPRQYPGKTHNNYISNDIYKGVSFATRETDRRIFMLLNFPHTITMKTSIQDGEESKVISGIVNAIQSVTQISGVQWSTDNDPQGTWNECVSVDGAFDSTNEEFNCSANSFSNTDAIYVRAYDENSSYTSPPIYPRLPTRSSPTMENSWVDFVPSVGRIVTKHNVSVLASPEAFISEANLHVNIQPKSLPLIRANNHWQTSDMYNVYLTYNEGSLILPEHLNGPVTLVFNYTDGDLVAWGQTFSFPEENIKIAHSDDKETWSLLDTHLNADHRTVSTITKPSGYYVLVSTFLPN
ncbi:hypothetical protein ACFL2C_00520 [Patescibacteria group bacterium]